MRNNLITDDYWRKNVIKSAWDFVNIIWIPTEKNLCHGKDENGKAINTPDINCLSEKFNGWWRVGEKNQGMPYKWGGFSTVEEFQKGISEGKYAGNVPDSTESGNDECVGIDCSGLVSRCWGLKWHTNTKELLSVSSSTDNLLPGDILLLPKTAKLAGHVVIFAKFTDIKKSYAQIIEANSSFGKVLSRNVKISEYIDKGYARYCYKNNS